MESERKPSKAGLVVLIIAFFCGGFCLGIVFDKEVLAKKENNVCEEKVKDKKEEPKKTEEPKEKEEEPKEKEEKPIQQKPAEEKKELTKEEAVKNLKKIMLEGGLAKFELIADWTFDEFYKVGYYKDKPNVIYYYLNGKFKCSAFEEGLYYPSCVYQDQLGDPDERGYYDWMVYLEVIETEDGYKFGKLLGDSGFLDDDSFVRLD